MHDMGGGEIIYLEEKMVHVTKSLATPRGQIRFYNWNLCGLGIYYSSHSVELPPSTSTKIQWFYMWNLVTIFYEKGLTMSLGRCWWREELNACGAVGSRWKGGRSPRASINPVSQYQQSAKAQWTRHCWWNVSILSVLQQYVWFSGVDLVDLITVRM